MAHSSFGGGWPSCNRSRIVTLVRSDGLRIPLHQDLIDLVQICLDVTEALGYDVKSGQTWGYACRPIAGTNKPSNHSWGTAVDINSLDNPRRARGLPMVTNIPPNIRDFWKACGFRWGGDFSWPDPMHFEYMGSTDQAREKASDLRRFFSARGGPGPLPAAATPPPYPGTFRIGDRGPGVKVWQRRLRDVGFGHLVVDGIFGQRTRDAVIRFQTDHHLSADGIAGQTTWHWLWFGT